MRRAFLSTVAALAVVGLVQAGPAPKPAATSELEGTKWSVKVVPDAQAAEKGESSFADTLVFEKNKVLMTECAKFGFEASPYSTAKLRGALSFSTEQNSKAGKTVWTAEIKGESIKGKLKWTKEDGTVLNYTFEGAKQ